LPGYLNLQKENVIQAVGEEPICITGHPGFAAVCLNAWGIHLSAGLFKTRQERKYQKTGAEERYYKIKVNRKHDLIGTHYLCKDR
jgi:hypothetical protein